jgi:glycosyltransferase involved in cell wall biosynthesis
MRQPNTPLAAEMPTVVEQAKLDNTARRLLFVTPRYAPLMGGVETHVEQVARRLAESHSEDGLSVHVLTTGGPDLPAEEVRQGVNIQRVPYWPRAGDLYFAPALERIIRQGGWDLMHLQSYHTLVAPLAMLAARRAGIPYVVTFHGGGHSDSWRNAMRRGQQALLRPLLAGAERLVAVAEFEIEYFSQRLGIPAEKFVLIPNGADLPCAPERPVERGGGTLIASIGRLERYKGHHRILAALPHILEQRPDTRLWIAGSGPYEGELHRQAEELGVADRVEIRSVPPDNRHQMAEELAGVDLVVLLSEYETHPIAVLEALAHGRPVLLADTSGMRELGRKGWARTIPLESSPAGVARAVLEQLERPLRPENVQIPTWDDCAEGLLDLYRSIWESRE